MPLDQHAELPTQSADLLRTKFRTTYLPFVSSHDTLDVPQYNVSSNVLPLPLPQRIRTFPPPLP